MPRNGLIAAIDYINLTQHQKLAQEVRDYPIPVRTTLSISEVDLVSQRPNYHNYIESANSYPIYIISDKSKN